MDKLSWYEDVLHKLSAEVANLKSSGGVRAPQAPPRSTTSSLPPRPPEEEFEDMQSFLHAAEQDPVSEMSEQLLLPRANLSTSTPSAGKGRQTIFEWLDRIFKSNDVTAILYGPPEGDRPPFEHPTPFDASQLWSIYCDNIHPISKMVDRPATQRLIRQVANGTQVTIADHALLFAVYSSALATISPEQCMTAFNKSHANMQAELWGGARYWLHRAHFWKTQDFRVLQAFVVFLSCLHPSVDPRSIATFTATADRIAKRLGLHRQAAAGIDAATAELRRRVWWELQIMEARSCEKCGLGASVLFNNRCIALPSVREDLTEAGSVADTSTAETASPSPEMLCFLIRCETAKFLADLRSQQGGDVGWTEFSTAQWSLSHKLSLIRDFQARVELRYLIHCDTRDRLHNFTRRLTDLMITRMRLAAYISEESLHARKRQASHATSHPNGHSSSNTSASVDASDEAHTVRTQMLMLCLQVMDNFGFMLDEPSLRGFQWILRTNMPFVAFVHLFRLLRTHTTGPLVDRIWTSVEANAKLWRGPPQVAATKQTSLFNYPLMKAWTARRAAMSKEEQQKPEPAYIQRIRSVMEDDEAPHKKPGGNVGTEEGNFAATSTSTSTYAGSPAKDPSLFDPTSGIDWEQWFQDFIFDGNGPTFTPSTGSSGDTWLQVDGSTTDSLLGSLNQNWATPVAQGAGEGEGGGEQQRLSG